MLTLVYVAILGLVIWGIVALASKKEMTDEEYEARKQGGPGIGNALTRGAAEGLAVAQGILEPGREKVVETLKDEHEEGDETAGSGKPK